MAKRIGNLNAQITADGIQFRTEMEKCVGSTRKFSGENRRMSDGVLADLERLTKKGLLGKLQQGFFHVAAAASTAWAAFQAGQAIRERLEQDIETITTKTRTMVEELRKANNIGDVLGSSDSDIAKQTKQVQDLSDKVGELTAKRLRMEETGPQGTLTGGGVASDALREEDAARKQLEIEKGRLAALKERARVQRQMDEGARMGDEMMERFAQSQRDAAEAARDQEQSLRDAMSVGDEAIEQWREADRQMQESARRLLDLDQRVAGSRADMLRRTGHEQEAAEMESAQRIADLKAQLDAERDASAREKLKELIALEEQRGLATRPGRSTSSSPSLEAVRGGSGEEARTLMFAANARLKRDDDTQKRQLRAQEAAIKILKSIDTHVQQDLEISLL